MADRMKTDQTLKLTPNAPVPEQATIEAQRSWLKDGTIPLSYVAAMTGGSSSSASVPQAAALVAGNRANR